MYGCHSSMEGLRSNGEEGNLRGRLAGCSIIGTGSKYLYLAVSAPVQNVRLQYFSGGNLSSWFGGHIKPGWSEERIPKMDFTNLQTLNSATVHARQETGPSLKDAYHFVLF